MKDIFKGFYRKSDSEIKKIWDNCIITFDANVLLNLYRYSPNTQTELLKIIEKFSDKIWLTHQACLEYHRNRSEVISEQEKVYNTFRTDIEQIENNLSNLNKPPFLSKKLHSKLKKVFSDVKVEVDENKKSLSNMITKDKIYDKVNLLFTGKIGLQLSEQSTTQILKEGEQRYKSKIPPGYEDNKKEDISKYGDLLMWKQIIEHSKTCKKPIIFITDEQKKDWWWKLRNGKIIGPRQELIEELWKEAKMDFLMYSSERFLTYGSELLEETLNKQAVNEIVERQKIRRKIIKKPIVLNKNSISFEIHSLARQIQNKMLYSDHITNKINSLKHTKELLSDEEIKTLQRLKDERKELGNHIKKLIQEQENIALQNYSNNR